MNKKFAFICIGQAAGNIGDLFAKKGYNVFAINTAKEDIETLKYVKNTYHVPGATGCGKNRNLAKSILIDHVDEICEKIKQNIPEEFVYFVFSGGGGTGSGFAPWFMDICLQDLFIKEDPEDAEQLIRTKQVGAITILPSTEDSPQAKKNAYTCMQELSEVEGLNNVFIVDNKNPRSLFMTNEELVDMFDMMVSAPSLFKSSRGVIDNAEIDKGFSTPGVSVIVKIDGERCTTKSYEEALSKGIFAALDTAEDRKVLSYVFSSTIEPLQYNEIKNTFGVYKDEFHTFNYETNILMLCGLPYPEERLNELGEQAMQETQETRRNSMLARKNTMKKLNFNDDEEDDISSKIIKRTQMEITSKADGTLSSLQVVSSPSRKEQLRAKLKRG